MIKNKSNGKLISIEKKVCKNVFSKLKGLMFEKEIKEPLVFVFKKNNYIALHMCFVFFPIDVLFLDENKIVVDKKENFLPWTFYTSKEKALYAIELDYGIIKKTKTKVGDKIEF